MPRTRSAAHAAEEPQTIDRTPPGEAPSAPETRAEQAALTAHPLQRRSCLRAIEWQLAVAKHPMRTAELVTLREVYRTYHPVGDYCRANLFELADRTGYSVRTITRAFTRLREERSTMPPNPGRGHGKAFREGKGPSRARPRRDDCAEREAPLGFLRFEYRRPKHRDCPHGTMGQCKATYRAALRAWRAQRKENAKAAGPKPEGCFARHGDVLIRAVYPSQRGLLDAFARLEAGTLRRFARSAKGAKGRRRGEACSVTATPAVDHSPSPAVDHSPSPAVDHSPSPAVDHSPSPAVDHPYPEIPQQRIVRSPSPPGSRRQGCDLQTSGSALPRCGDADTAPAAREAFSLTTQATPAPTQPEAVGSGRATVGPTSTPVLALAPGRALEDLVDAWVLLELPALEDMERLLAKRFAELAAEGASEAECLETLRLAGVGVARGGSDRAEAARGADKPGAFAYGQLARTRALALEGRRVELAEAAQARREARTAPDAREADALRCLEYYRLLFAPGMVGRPPRPGELAPALAALAQPGTTRETLCRSIASAKDSPHNVGERATFGAILKRRVLVGLAQRWEAAGGAEDPSADLAGGRRSTAPPRPSPSPATPTNKPVPGGHSGTWGDHFRRLDEATMQESQHNAHKRSEGRGVALGYSEGGAPITVAATVLDERGVTFVPRDIPADAKPGPRDALAAAQRLLELATLDGAALVEQLEQEKAAAAAKATPPAALGATLAGLRARMEALEGKRGDAEQERVRAELRTERKDPKP